MTDTSGPTSPTPFAYYDPDSRSLRTSQDTFLLGLPMSSVTLPKSGSMRNGQLYERPTLARHTGGNDSSSLLPTPDAGGGGKTIPADAVWNKSGTLAYKPDGTKVQVGLSAISQLLPTPSAIVANDGETTETWLARRERVKLTANNGNGMGTPLSIAVQLLHGAIMSPPSTDGSAYSGDQHPTQPPPGEPESLF